MGRVPLCPPVPASPGPHIPAPEMLQSRGLRVWEGDLWPQYPHTLLLPRARPYSLPEQSSCRQVGSPCLWPEGTLGLLQASTWSPGCWNTPSPRLQLTCSWPGACLQKVGEHTGTVPALWHLGPCAFVFRCMSRAAGTPPPPPAPDAAPLELEPAAEEGTVGPPEPSRGTAQPVRRDLGKVPKWLKLPGTLGVWPGGVGLWAGAQGPDVTLCVCLAAGKR